MSRTSLFSTEILCVIFAATVGSAQGLFFTAGAGYGLGAGTQTIGGNLSSTGTEAFYEGVYGSFGEGFKFGASAGYMFNRNIGAELGFSYWLGRTLEFTIRSTGSTTTFQVSGSGFVAVPSIVIASGMETINPYARFGVVVGILSTKEEARSVQSGQNAEYTQEESGSLAFGYAGAVGIVVPSGGAVDFFAEVSLYSVTYSPHQEEVTRLTVNGADQLGSLTQRVIEFKESLTSGDPLAQLAVRRPFSAIGFAVGARINL